MTPLKRILANTFSLVSADIIGKILSFGFMLYVTRYLGPEKYGVLSFGLAFTGIFSIFTDLGLKQLIVREVARDTSLAKKYLANFLSVKILLGIFTVLSASIAVNLLGYPRETVRVVYALAIFVALMGITQLFYAIFLGHEKMHFQSIGNVTYSTVLLAGGVYIILRGGGVGDFALAYLASGVFCLLYSVAVTVKWFRLPGIRLETGFIKSNMRQALPFGMAAVFVMIFYWIDSVMLSMMRGDAEVGWYNAAYRLVLVLLIFPSAFISAIYPYTSRIYESAKDVLKKTYEKTFRLLSMIALPVGVGTTLLAERIILLFFGSDYAESVIALQILVWSSVIIYMSYSFANLFNSLNRQIIVTRIAGAALLTNILLNLLLIPRYGMAGAAATTVFTEFITLALNIVYARKIGYTIVSRINAVFLVKVLAANAVMAGIVYGLFSLHVFIIVPVAGAAYLLTAYLLGAFDREDRLLASRILSGIARML